MKKIHITYFVHGTTKDNENDISSGWSDVDLSSLGIEQSKYLGELVKDKKFDTVFTSDLRRAKDTSKLAFSNFEIVEDKRLRECNYGVLNGAQSAEVEPKILDHITKPFPNGESYRDVEKRVKDFVNYLKKNYLGKNIAIVSHRGPQLALDVIVKGMSWKQAVENDWRHKKAWKPGWEYVLEC